MKIMTVLGTRPEIIRLSRIIPQLDALADHVLVHTGQNFDARLSDIFFSDLGVRQPDHTLGVRGSNFAEIVGQILIEGEKVIRQERPDRLLDPGRYQQRAGGGHRQADGHPGVSHGGGQPLLRRPRPGGGQPAHHRPQQRRADALHRAQPGQPAARRESPGSGFSSPATRSRKSWTITRTGSRPARRWRIWTCRRGNTSW